MSQDAIVIDVALDAPPDLVWRALTEPELVARWLGATDVEARIGRRFTVEPAAGKPPVDCEVIEVEPERLLSYRWREGGEGRAAALDTVVTWVLDATPDGGTRLRLVHDGFPIVVARPAHTVATRASHPHSAHSRESGNPGFFVFESADCIKNLGPRLRGDERAKETPRRKSKPLATLCQGGLKWAA
jgi:uncharacterized protein YndB with AHSA1/START domain